MIKIDANRFPLPILTLDAEGRILHANPQAQKIPGLNAWIGKGLSEILSPTPDFLQNKEGLFHIQLGESKTPFRIQSEWDPEACRFYLILLEENVNDEVQKSTSTAMAVEQTPNTVFITDTNGIITYANHSLCTLTGYEVDEILGQNPRIFKSGESGPEVYNRLWNTIKSGKPWTGVFHNKKKNGERYWSWNHVTPIVNEQGEIQSFLAIGEDITVLKETTEALQKERALLHTLINSLDEDVMLMDKNRKVLAFNQAALEIRGLSEHLVMPMEEPNPTVRRFLPSGVPQKLEDNPVYITATTGTPQYNIVYGVQKKMDEPIIWLSVNTEAIFENNEISAIVLCFRDISKEREAQSQLEMVAKVFDHASEGILITDHNTRIVRVNSAFTKITGYSAQDVIGQTPKMFQSGQQDPEFYKSMWDAIHNDGEWNGELWNRRKSGDVYAEQLSISCIRDPHGKITNYIGLFLDITERKQHEEEIHRLAYFDPLTTLPNRVLLSDRMDQAISRSRRTMGLMAISYMDLDGFKEINDTHGHEVGDLVLVEVAKRLLQELRPTDTVARLGGDEFVVLLSDVASSEEVHRVIQRLTNAIAKPIHLHGLELEISSSFGIAIYPGDGEDADSLLRNADQAMYLAKQSGRNRIQLFDSSSEKKAREHKEIRDKIVDAMNSNELELFYQPKIHLASGSLMGAEALIRWRHDGNLIMPGQFLPAIERDDLMVRVGDWIVHEVFQQLVRWDAQGLSIAASINIAGRQLQDRGFLGLLMDALADNPSINPSRISLEIVETTALEDIEMASSMLSECRKMGFKTSLDDFGTGYSSLSYFRKLPIDIIKIDQSFVRDMLSDAEDMSIVQGIIGMSKAFSRVTVAEGVEYPEHLEQLRSMGCDYAQGYTIAKPMEKNQFFEWAKNYGAVKT